MWRDTNERSYAFCRPDPKGAWAIYEERVAYTPPFVPTEPWSRSAKLVFARVDATGIHSQQIDTLMGPASENAPEPFDRLERGDCCRADHGSGPVPGFYGDLDGDGVPEIELSAEYHWEGEDNSWRKLFRYAGGKVALLAEDYAAIEDQTGDGLPDIAYRRKYDAGSYCGSGFSRRGEGPPFIAHNRGGGVFSEDDAEAKAFVRKNWCPARPTSFDSGNLTCAALWGLRAAAEKWITEHYAPLDCDAAMAGRPQPDARASEDYDGLMGALGAGPPFSFADDAGSE